MPSSRDSIREPASVLTSCSVHYQPIQKTTGDHWYIADNITECCSLYRLRSRMHPSRLKARAYVLDILRSPRYGPGTRLPTIAHMATSAGVASRTMWRAIRQLVEEGCLEARPRAGIHVTGPGAGGGQTRSSSRATGSQRLRDAIEHDLARGRFTSDTPLPSAKQLLALYGGSHTTLRKALAALVDSGLLMPWGAGYRVRPLGPSRSGGTVLFVAHASGEAFMSAMEAETAKSGATLEVRPLYPYRALLRDISSRGERREGLAGIIVSIVGGQAYQYQDILAHVYPLRVPVAIIDPTGGATDPPRPPHRLLRTFTLADYAAQGRHVGRFLLQSGHRHVAFISPILDTGWARERFQGLSDAFAGAGLTDAVHLFEPSDAASMVQSKERFGEILSRATAELSNRGPDLATIAHLIDRRREALLYEAQWQERARIQESLMERALDESNSTAWVACNDRAGIAAMEYLSRTRRQGTVCVVGFDDIPEASTYGLTSYNRNMSAAIRAALGHVFGHRFRYVGESRSRPVSIEGFVNVRRRSMQAHSGSVRSQC
ncbi:MAG: GntR family transcriptional regulator [Chitinivibrionales bacterium]|nr:GntR family transcriptional regulator [Chitinivibrionales bacterium]